MAPPPVDRNRGESMAGDMARSVPTPFLTKTYQLVSDYTVDDIISWNEDGSAFVVWNPTEFTRDLLPKYFKHNNFSSFVRQLNTYGFRKVVPDRWEFSNECFRRGERKLLCDIQRRKVSTSSSAASREATKPERSPPWRRTASPTDSGEEQVISSSNSPQVRETSSGKAELIRENDRLRKENMQLNKELCKMKSLCNKVYVLMSNYATHPNNSGNSHENVNGHSTEPLDLIPMRTFCQENCIRIEAEEMSARLFGVRIGVKRGRESEGRTAEHEMELQLQQPGTSVKPEPLDAQNSSDDQEIMWFKRCDSRKEKERNRSGLDRMSVINARKA